MTASQHRSPADQCCFDRMHIVGMLTRYRDTGIYILLFATQVKFGQHQAHRSQTQYVVYTRSPLRPALHCPPAPWQLDAASSAHAIPTQRCFPRQPQHIRTGSIYRRCTATCRCSCHHHRPILSVRLSRKIHPTAHTFQRSTPVAVDSKSDASPVTVADREAEAAMRAVLQRLVPDHGIFGEEAGYEAGSSDDYVWVLDPIDGTKSFITGTFAVRIVHIFGLINRQAAVWHAHRVAVQGATSGGHHRPACAAGTMAGGAGTTDHVQRYYIALSSAAE